mmetsp:Transcript_19407/g.23129  ORF Transcript_19407/g.23129 Transcript_19407/m.23129 type:complete len:835 (+) Transcript_19407:153-2657(+)|eukprot:CAMPEP_0198252106 /NCGR_PEP_ID=MMETSP1447-20131203/2699_1 /TAXON_ID=420782 /ORGANISM="Chaetoceros dichaeta, Strain CCMP1751" /LENGTH=834 /DNA_ID=CAMNT_0043937269 /DNA_START=47 /DNA_END=2551 /DNA_ORIENTATION=-
MKTIVNFKIIHILFFLLPLLFVGAFYCYHGPLVLSESYKTTEPHRSVEKNDEVLEAQHSGDKEKIEALTAQIKSLTGDLFNEKQDAQKESRGKDDKVKDLEQELESKILELKASAESHLDDSRSGLRGSEREHDHNDEDDVDILPTPGFPNIDCEEINWFGKADNDTACYDRMLADENCGKRFMTYNVINKECACYPIDMAVCTIRHAAGHTSWDFEPFASSFDGALIAATETLSKDSLPSSLFEPHEICSFFPSPTFTASSIWLKYLPTIFNASQNPYIPKLITHQNNSTMRQLLNHVLTPSRMRRAIQHLPTGSYSYSHSSVKHVIDIIQKRIQDPENNPPLRIAVFGGSVTLGRGCEPGSRRMTQVECSWVRRFELLVNQFASIVMKKDDNNKNQNIVEVYNNGVGGTATNVGAKMVKYWMYTGILKSVGPDVIIHSYSTNDSTPPWNMEEGADSHTITSNSVRQTVQDFIRNALRSKPCSDQPPLVIDVDDYLGPQHKTTLGELSYNTVMTQLAKWYDVASISYAEVVRDIVYNDVSGSTFYNKKDVHYGFWAHQTIAWSVGFGALELVSNYCDDEYLLRKERQTGAMSGEKQGDDQERQQRGRQQVFLPPILTSELLHENITNEFNAASDEARDTVSTGDIECSEAENGDTKTGAIVKNHNPCPIAWVSSPGGYNANAIDSFIGKFQSLNKDWKVEDNMAEGWGNKVGWIADGPNATFSLSFKDLGKSINKISIFYLQSYGEKWEGSRVRITFSTGGTGKKIFEEEKADDISILSVGEISGFSNMTGSPTMVEEFLLPDSVPKEDVLNVKFDIIDGSTFKIMGMMLCQG